MKLLISLLLPVFSALSVLAQTAWQANLDSRVSFYQTTDFGVILTGTERSLYAVDSKSGERLWRRETGGINETAVTPVPDTDVVLLARDMGSRSVLEAVDIISGGRIWQSDKVKGDVLQLAADPASDLVAVVMVKDPRGNAGEEFKKKPIVHVLQLSTGEEIWKRELDSDIEMMPARFGEGLGEVAYTLDNYRAPLLLDGRLFLFYEGATSYDARTGKEKEREKFRINEDGLALTEADPVFDDSRIYISGRGRIRAVDRRTGNVEWKADDVGSASEMAIIGNILYVRTGGRFTRLRDGESVAKGPYGLSALDTQTGKVLWRWKGADKGLTNVLFLDRDTAAVADNNELFLIDAGDGDVRSKIKHEIDDAEFAIINEKGQIVIGGKDEIAAFNVSSLESQGGNRTRQAPEAGAIILKASSSKSAGDKAVWRVRHKAPSRGVFRIVAGIALRATALYFRYGGFATSAVGLFRTGANLASAANSLRWSGLRSRFGSFNLTTLASTTARNYVTGRIYSYGSFARTPGILTRVGGLQVITPSSAARSMITGAAGRAMPSRAEVQDSIFDRLDPARYADRLSDYLLRRKRLSELRGNYMYFYTDLPKPFDRKGLVGVNVHDGKDGRFILASDPDAQFVTDETVNLLYSADGNTLKAFEILNR
ncbi:MAG TPA: PQQ-binding-like beta-propeller repeat protein [Pyrinomonadaceae bacterium]|nr:PQQ-binding-like beta-propeller repeat protein [Pyrinomonadaceae bacterium]